MCGIFGIIKPPKDIVNEKEILFPLNNIKHRGPDGFGIFKHRNVGLGHQRLAIFDLDDRGAQPMDFKGYTISFNGAIYNFPEIRKTLIENGYSFSTETDTEVILAAYDHWEEACLKRFNGQWAFAIYDKERHSIFLSRDRFGIKPLYYTQIDGNFYFSSEIKSFLKVPGWSAKINNERASEFLRFGMHDHTNQTLFENVFECRKGHSIRLSCEDFSFEESCFYDIDDVEEQEISEKEAIGKFSTLFEKSIALRKRADVKIGSALSGGLDSSSIVQTMIEKDPSEKVETFSIVYDDPEISERKYVDAILKSGNVNGHVFSPDHNYIEELEVKVIWHQEEPFNGFGVFAQYALFEKVAKSEVKVMLDGQGADEILAGYEKFYLGLLNKKKSNLFRLVNSVYSISLKHGFTLKDILKQFRSFLNSGKQKQVDWLKIKVDPEKLFRRKSDDSILNISKNLLKDLGIGALLRFEDKNSLAFGIESRVPFLDHNLVEFCLSLPDNYKIRNGIRKWILRESRKEVLPEIILNRYDKLGFATPEAQWMKANRNSYLDEIIQNEKLKEIVDVSKIDERVPDKVVWRIYLFGKWMKMFEVSVD